MAVKFLVGINLNTSELQNAVIHNLATASIPAGVSGQIVYDTSLNKLKYYNGNTWKTVSETGSTVNSIIAGSGISISGTTDVTISHADTSSVANLVAGARAYVTAMTFDTYGHVQSVTTATETTTTDYINAASFNTANGVLTLSGIGSAGATVDLDGRFLLPADEAFGFKTIVVTGQETITADSTVGTLTLVAGTNVTIVTDGVADSVTINSTYVNNFTSGITFNTGDGVLTLTRTGLSALTVDLDGRYLQSYTETQTLDAVTALGATTTNAITVGGLTVNGNLTVSGAVQTKVSETLLVEDALFVLNSNEAGAATNDAGFVIERGTDTNAAFLWDESADEFVFITTEETGTTAGNIEITDYSNIHAGAAEFNGTLKLDSVVNAAVDTDKFLVLDATGNVDFRTGAEVLSDIGASAAGAMFSFILTDGTTPTTVTNGETITFSGTGNVTVTQAGDTFTVNGTQYVHPTHTAISINTAGAEVIDLLTVNTLGHTTAATLRTMTLADLGYTGDTNANYYVLPAATEAVVGGVELATITEASAGTDTTRAVTAAGLQKFKIDNEYRTFIGDGVSLSFDIDHNLNTRDVIVQLYDASTYDTVYADVIRDTVDGIIVTFAVAPTTNDIRVLVMKLG